MPHVRLSRPARSCGPVVIFAPHPDDEVIGCGGLLAQLAFRHVECTVVYVTDGSGSHPNSRKFDAVALARLRASEARAGLRRLGLRTPPVFLGQPDGSLSRLRDEFRTDLLDKLTALVERLNPDRVYAPWRRDVHADHIATSELVEESLERLSPKPALYMYPVWLHVLGTAVDFPRPGEATAMRRTLSARDLSRKRAALAEHRSQTTALIDDDPDAFRATPAMLAAWMQPREQFFGPA